MKEVLLLVLVVLVSGCSSMDAKQIMGAAAGNAADTQVAYGKQCFALKSQCGQGIYEEWQTSDKVDGCSCKKL